MRFKSIYVYSHALFFITYYLGQRLPIKEMGSHRNAKNSRLIPVPAAALYLPLGEGAPKGRMRGIPAAAGNPPLFLRIRRLCLLFCSAVSSPPAGDFLCSPEESHQRNALKGTCAEAVPLRIPPPPAKGAAAPIGSPGGLRETKDEWRGTGDWTGNGLPHPLRGFAMTAREAGLKNAAGGRARGEAVICSSLYGIR